MSQVDRIRPFRPSLDEAELEAIRARTIARLSSMSDATAHRPVPDGEAAESVDVEHGDHDIRVVDHPDPIEFPPPIVAGADPDDLPIRTVEATSARTPTSDVWAGLWEPATPVDEPDAPVVDAPRRGAPTPDATAAPRRRSTAPRKTKAARVSATAYCPYCALELDPVPTSDRRCTRCRQQIVVRESDGRLVHLTEAAVEVFEAERIRAANIERWTAERHQWLELAGINGASIQRIERMERSPAETVDEVDAARAFFASTVDHGVDEALRHDQWEVAAQLRRDQATAMRRIAGPDGAVTDEILGLSRDAAATELRGIAAMARTATLVGSRCCETCRADDGTVVRIAGELRRSRLPHAACPKGPCRCRWDLAPSDILLVQRYLERTGRWSSGTDATR